MLLSVPDVLSAAQVARARQVLDAAAWVDGNVTSGHQSAKAKSNEQLPEDHPAAREVGGMILQALNGNPLFFLQRFRNTFFRRCSIVMRRAKSSARTSTTRCVITGRPVRAFARTCPPLFFYRRPRITTAANW
jgi:hypothetical protein